MNKSNKFQTKRMKKAPQKWNKPKKSHLNRIERVLCALTKGYFRSRKILLWKPFTKCDCKSGQKNKMFSLNTKKSIHLNVHLSSQCHFKRVRIVHIWVWVSECNGTLNCSLQQNKSFNIASIWTIIHLPFLYTYFFIQGVLYTITILTLILFLSSSQAQMLYTHTHKHNYTQWTF